MKELENENTRSPTAFFAFVNCIQHLETFETKWKRMEEEENIRIKEKGRFGIDERVMYFVVETQKDFDQLSVQYPGRILLCDRSVIQDTVLSKPIKGTNQLHEVRSLATSIPEEYEGVVVRAVMEDVEEEKVKKEGGKEDGEKTKDGKKKTKGGKKKKTKRIKVPEVKGMIRKWPVLISNLPCNCKRCNAQKNDDGTIDKKTTCSFSTWRKTRVYGMETPSALEPKQAVTLSEEDYLASQAASAVEERHGNEVEANAPEEARAADEGGEPRHHSDASSIEPLVTLLPEARAKIVRLLEAESNSNYNLTYAEQSANGVQHTSLKRLLANGWLDDEVINAINIHYLRQKLDENSHIYHSQFMAKLLQTGEHGTAEPSYDYSQVSGWSGSVGQNGLFGLQNLYIPINHN